MKLLLGAGLCGLMWLAAIASRRPKLVLLFAWVVSLTYNRQYFSFEAIAGNNSSQGPYWIVSDVFLIALLAVWVYEAAIRKRPRVACSFAVHPLFLPFALVCAVSALGAQRPDWSLYELIRSVKVFLILLYVQYNFTKEEWWTAAVAMTAAIVLQSSLGVMEVTTRRSGLLGVLGMTSTSFDVPDELTQENFYGWHRATGTMNHPPNLACYLLLTLPLPLAVALARAPRHVRVIAGGAGLLGLAGLACTLSRWPWVLVIGQIGLLLVTLTWLRMLPVQQMLGIASIGALAGGIALLPFADFIADRISRDFDRSVEFREQENRVAVAMFADHPLFGVGPNNYKLHLGTYGSDMVWALASEDLAVRMMHVRFIAAPQNGFLLPLAETGILGLSAFLFYLVAVVVVGLRAIAGSSGWPSAAVLALVIGILGVIAQQIVDYSFWTDPVFYTFTLIVGMLAAAPVLNDAGPERPGRRFPVGRSFQGRLSEVHP
jgi:O-Antigen ligase